jgi:hypothetical protein
MSRKKRQQNLREAKDKRMKKVAIGGAVLLVAVLAFEVPKMLHSSGSSTSSPPPATTTTAPGASTAPASTPAPATTPPGTAAAAVAPTAASTKLPNSDLSPARAKSQLFSFSHFAGKDPFVQQVNTSPAAQGSTGTSSGSGKKSSTPAGGTTTAAINHKPTRTLAANGAARISVNGRIQVVRVGASFPSANPLFRLVSVAGGVARIGIASGSYTSGARTVSLASGRSLTLVDTADGVRYSIRLISAA